MTSTGCIFFIAMEKVMRSCDYGETWEEVQGPACSFTTSDPYGWVDPITDRIFNVQMQGLKLHGFVGVMMMGKPGQAIHTILELPR